MISVNLSIDQLIEVIQNLDDAEKQQIRTVLNNGPALSEHQKKEILTRESEYKSGKMKTFSLEEVKAGFNLPG